ncbi:hypothetical protein HNP24_001093 [Chryseobacterium sediminis]|uniref:Uncharacterized protein n=1 Tax=Chryseobacterium sediminis TaxID=1679494 RepID=A0ABR6PWQ3_9FLAO|nr:hypothetical protein [Chryseobacterium sediminis]MBB6330143.1 hypothetical protein [Chryseobacterium sediminis]
MGKNTSQIKLSEGEAVKVIADLGRIIVSPGKIKSHFAEETENTTSKKQQQTLYLFHDKELKKVVICFKYA